MGIMTVVGTRPQLIKSSYMSGVFDKYAENFYNWDIESLKLRSIYMGDII